VAAELAAAVAFADPDWPTPRFPVMCDAHRLAGADHIAALLTGRQEHATALLRTGAVALIVDGFDTLPEGERDRAAALLRAARAEFPHTVLVVCHRRAGYLPELFDGFDHVTLREPTPAAIDRYLVEFFLSRRVERARPRATSLAHLLTDESSPRRLPAGFRSPALLSLAAALAATPEPSDLPWSGVGELIDLYVRRQADLPPDTGSERTAVREYLAARRLQQNGDRDGLLADIAADPRRHETCRLLLTLPGTDPALVAAVVTAVLDHDRVRAAHLLRSMSRPPADVLDVFLDRQRAALRDIEATPDTYRDAAAALAEYGRRRARDLLAALVADDRATPEARAAALDALERTAAEARSTPARERAEDALVSAVSMVLTAPAPTDLRVHALRTAQRVGLPRLHPPAGELIDPSQPWPVVSAAAAVLRSADAVWPRRLVDTWADACERRLADIETELPETANHDGCARLQHERRRLLAELWRAGRRDAVRARRFRFDVAEDVRRLLAGSDDESDLAGPLDLTRLTAAGSLGELLRAAAQIEHAPAGDRPAVAALVRDLIERVRADGADAGLMEATAALISGVFAVDRPRGVRLALHGARVWEESALPERWRWPWLVAFVRARGVPEDLERLLLADDEGRELAVIGLSSYRFFTEAGADPGYRLGARARAALLAGPDAESDDAKWRRVMAAATVGATDALPLAYELAAKQGFGATRRTVVAAADGLTERDDLTGLLAAIGYLARLTSPRVATDQVRAAHRLIRDADLTGRGPDAANGRLAGLAYLGDWRAVLVDADPDDPRSRRIADRAVTMWSPGPLSPPPGT
jgi:hypothetical protein